MSHNSVAASVRQAKEKQPGHYCTDKRCLWRTYDWRAGTFTPCPKHMRQYDELDDLEDMADAQLAETAARIERDGE